MSAELYTKEQRDRLWNHVSDELRNSMLESECHDLWCVATETCRKEIIRLERLVAFQVRGRVHDAQVRNDKMTYKELMEFSCCDRTHPHP